VQVRGVLTYAAGKSEPEWGRKREKLLPAYIEMGSVAVVEGY